jgi:DNA modification methylase
MSELDELISKQSRKKMARNMAKIAKKSSTKLKKARAALKMASPEKIKAKAHKKAKEVFANKLIGDKSWSDLSDQEKMQIEKKLAKKKGAIEKLSKKLAKQVKKDEVAKVKKNKES